MALELKDVRVLVPVQLILDCHWLICVHVRGGASHYANCIMKDLLGIFKRLVILDGKTTIQILHTKVLFVFFTLKTLILFSQSLVAILLKQTIK